jgi:hypothetical protein
MPAPKISGVILKELADLLTPDESQEEGTNSLLDWSVWSPQSSSAIVQVKHRLRDGMMTVRFTGGPIDYLFNGVPRELFRQWKRVKSPGGFYHRRIKGQYGI